MNKKILALALSIALIITMMPASAFGGQGRTSDGNIVISDKKYEVAPGIVEREYIVNNQDLSAQQSGHVLEVKLGEDAEIIAGYNDYNVDAIKSGTNWNMRRTTEQAQAVETSRGVNVVGAVNGDFFDMSNGRPRGVLVMNGTVIQKSSFPCFYIDEDNVPHIEESSANLPESVKEAVGGAAVIVKDRKPVSVGDETKNPRTAIGIRADNTVVIYMVDGRQAPLSVGMDYAELAATMIDLGCVVALNLDGGGSSTFATQRAGDTLTKVNEKTAGLTIRCNPSDGYERTVSSSVMVISKSQADGEFDHAVLTPNDDVYTPGSTIKFKAIGADKAGGEAQLPKEDLSWEVSGGADLGVIGAGEYKLDEEDQKEKFIGTFTAAADKTGEVTVSLLYNDKPVGSTKVQLQWPDKLAFTNSSISLDFGKESNLSFVPTYEGREVHYKDGDFEWSLNPSYYKFSTIVDPKTNNTKGDFSMAITPSSLDQDTVVVEYYAWGTSLTYTSTYRVTDLRIRTQNEEYYVDATVEYVSSGGAAGEKVPSEKVKTYSGKLGAFKNNCFFSDENNSLRGTVEVKLKSNPDVMGTTDVVVGMEPYMLMDFEDHKIISKDEKDENGKPKETIINAKDYWTVHVGSSKDNGGNSNLSSAEVKSSRLWIRDTTGKGVVWPADKDEKPLNSIVSAEEDSHVRFGNYAYRLAWDFSRVKSTEVGAADFGFSGDLKVSSVQPTKIGMWIYVPESCKNDNSVLKAVLKGAAGEKICETSYMELNEDGSTKYTDGLELIGTASYVQYYSDNPDGTRGEKLSDWAGKDWTWVEADISAYQMPLDVCRAYTVRVTSPQNGTKGSGHILIDNLQFIYGSNPNDTLKPVIESVEETGSHTIMSTEGAAPTFTTAQPAFDIVMNDSEATDKNASKIDPSSIRIYIDGDDKTSAAEISQNERGILTARIQSGALLNGERTLVVRVKDNYGNKTEKEYKFIIESEEAEDAALRVMPQDGNPVIGKSYLLKLENQSEFTAEYVDDADVTVKIGEKYGAVIADDLSNHIAYGEGYEEAAAPEYSDGNLTLHVKKTQPSQDESGEGNPQTPIVYGKTIATISLDIPENGKKGETLTYSVPGGKYKQNTKIWTFSQFEQEIPLSAKYTISAGDAIAGYPLTFNVTDGDGNPAEGTKLYLENDAIENPHKFTAAGRYTVYAKDAGGNRSWNYDVVVNALGNDGDGKPFGIQNNISKDGASQKTITWLSAIEGSKNSAYIKLAETEEALAEAEKTSGTSSLITFTEANSGNAYRLNEVKLSSLESGKAYYYMVGDGEKWSEVLSFTTASAEKGAKTNFFLFGDIQTDNTANLSAAIKRIEESGTEYAFGIQTGDAIDNVTAFNNWRAYLTVLNAEKLAGIDVMHTLGNHEYYGDADGKTAGSMFSIPAQAHAAGGYYSAEYGSIYVGVINDGGDMLAALETAKEDAAASSCAWKALVFHQPVYGTESFMEEAKRLAVTKAIEDAGFDVVFSGDDHAYARTYPMKGDQALAAGSRDGVVYYICGDLSGKSNAYNKNDIYAAAIPHNDYDGMYLSVEADASKMVLTAYKYNGEFLDSYTIQKTDCELGNHTVDETCTYDLATGMIHSCILCRQEVSAEESGYTGILSVSGGSGKVALVGGKAKSGWFVIGEEIFHAGEDAILHQTKTYNTATCLKDGYIMADCDCGEHYTGAKTYRKGHIWDEQHVCTVCGAQGKDLAKVTLKLDAKSWEYTGKAIHASVSAYDGKYKLIATSSNYANDAYISYEKNTNVGMGTVVFDGRGNYYGTKSIDFPIVPQSVKEIKVEPLHSSAAKLTWDAAGGAEDYCIYMRNAYSSSWEKVGTTKDTSMIVSGLNPGAKYSFRIETETKVDGTVFKGLKQAAAEILLPEETSGKTSEALETVSAVVGTTNIKTITHDGKTYLMLPSNADKKNLTLALTAKEEISKVTILGTLKSETFAADALTFDVTQFASDSGYGEYKIYLSADDKEPMEICVMQSANIPALYLTSSDAQNRGREYVDAAKSNAVTGTMQLIDEDGTAKYDGELTQIKARGNSTFKYYPKKSYQIKLSEASVLLGSSESVKTWVLLAGYGDATQMHDKLFKDLAKRLQMPYTANCDWVDLYYDGEYRGTYLLSEKNSVGSTGIDITDMEAAYKEKNPSYGETAEVKEGTNKYEQKIVYTDGLTEPDNITGGYLIERNLEEIDEVNGFYTRTGSAFNVKSPEYTGKEAMEYISEYYQEFEDAVYATDEDGNYTGYNTATKKHYYDYCDKESLVKMVLLQQLALNPDGFLSSCYFYKDADGTMFAGPVWDLEMALGTGFTKKISASAENFHYLEEALVQIPDFKEALKEYYTSTFADAIKELISENGTTRGYYLKIYDSVQMNYKLWPYVEIGYPHAAGHLWKDGTNYDDVISDMNKWLTTRISLLDYTYGDKSQHTVHDYVDTVIKEPTYSEEGIMQHKCSICGDSYTTAISKMIFSGGGGGGILLPPAGEEDTIISTPEDPKNGTPASTTAEVKPDIAAKPDGGKTAAAEIDDKTADKILEKALENKSEEIIVSAAAGSPAEAGTTIEIALPEKTIQEISQKAQAGLTLKSDAGKVTLDKAAVDALASQAGTTGKVKLIVEVVKRNSDILQVELKIVTSKGEVKEFKEGNVAVTVNPEAALHGKNLICVYIDDNGTYHRVSGEKNADGTYTFTTGHFSSYAVLAEAEAEKIFAEQKEEADKLLAKVQLKARSAKTAKGSIKVMLTVTKGNVKALEELGYTVKYKYYRSTRKAKGYKAKYETKGRTYINTSAKKGTKYYYKARVMVYDAYGNLVTRTELKQCRYAARTK